jgi:hypothetical protein
MVRVLSLAEMWNSCRLEAKVQVWWKSMTGYVIANPD